MSGRSYTDEELSRAIASAHSWRGVLRGLGLRATSAGSARSVRRHADRIGLSYGHFTGQRRWTDKALTDAVAASTSWSQVADALGLAEGGGALTSLRAHATRLGIDTAHMGKQPLALPRAGVADQPYRLEHLRSAGSMFAAAWFALRGASVSWPLEPCRYDLLVDLDGAIQRVQVKTTIAVGASAVLGVANSRRTGRVVYGPNEIDFFFAIDGALTAYLLPYDLVAGFTEIRLGRYRRYIIVRDGALVPCATSISSPAP